MKLHLLQSAPLLNFTAEGGELIVAWHQGETPPDRIQSTRLVLKMGPELADFQPSPGVFRVQSNAGLRSLPRFFQTTAVHQGAGVAVVPDTAPRRLCLRTRGWHPLGCPVIKSVFIQVVAGIGRPECQLQVFLRLFLSKESPAHAIPYPLVQVIQHFIKIAGCRAAHFFQGLKILFCKNGHLCARQVFHIPFLPICLRPFTAGSRSIIADRQVRRNHRYDFLASIRKSARRILDVSRISGKKYLH